MPQTLASLILNYSARKHENLERYMDLILFISSPRVLFEHSFEADSIALFTDAPRRMDENATTMRLSYNNNYHYSRGASFTDNNVFAHFGV